MSALPDELVFPLPTGSPEHDLAAALAWYRRVIYHLRTSEQHYGLTPRMAVVFASTPPPSSSYGELLGWRAQFFDWLTDVWDVIDAIYDPRECSALQRFFGARQGRCSLCLSTENHGYPCPLLPPPPVPFSS